MYALYFGRRPTDRPKHQIVRLLGRWMHCFVSSVFFPFLSLFPYVNTWRERRHSPVLRTQAQQDIPLWAASLAPSVAAHALVACVHSNGALSLTASPTTVHLCKSPSPKIVDCGSPFVVCSSMQHGSRFSSSKGRFQPQLVVASPKSPIPAPSIHCCSFSFADSSSVLHCYNFCPIDGSSSVILGCSFSNRRFQLCAPRLEPIPAPCSTVASLLSMVAVGSSFAN